LNNKHIPEVYLKKFDVRLKVLAGLIDTDGYLGEGGYDFVLQTKRFEDIVQLSRSLGFKCRDIQSEDLYKCTRQNNVKLTDHISVVTI
jgi:hypothetical protein